MAPPVKPIPDGYHTATPALIVDNAPRALEFYAKALGGREKMRSAGPGGKIMHAEFQVGDSMFMLADEFPDMGPRSPKTLGGTASAIWLYVPDVDAAYRRAVAAGATSLSAPTDMFWGDRHARIRDPFGHEWSLATHREDPTPEEIEKRSKEFYAQMSKPAARKP
ncbi:MAG: VOC family protein [Thermoplasmata archaeon]|nr:VOC family protein [Thermoplasmata archaeon]